MADSFASSLFQQSFRRSLDKDPAGALKMGLNALLEVMFFKLKNRCFYR